VTLLEEQMTTRERVLVPVRRGRMMVSPFTSDLGAADHGRGPQGHPTAGLAVQLCGDGHLSNFGVFGTGAEAGST